MDLAVVTRVLKVLFIPFQSIKKNYTQKRESYMDLKCLLTKMNIRQINLDLCEINYDSFDKQFFRNYLINMKWNNNQIDIPEDIKQKLIQRYQLAYNLITS